MSLRLKLAHRPISAPDDVLQNVDDAGTQSNLPTCGNILIGLISNPKYTKADSRQNDGDGDPCSTVLLRVERLRSTERMSVKGEQCGR
jgi:hypothetical protein